MYWRCELKMNRVHWESIRGHGRTLLGCMKFLWKRDWRLVWPPWTRKRRSNHQHRVLQKFHMNRSLNAPTSAASEMVVGEQLRASLRQRQSQLPVKSDSCCWLPHLKTGEVEGGYPIYGGMIQAGELKVCELRDWVVGLLDALLQIRLPFLSVFLSGNAASD